MTYMLNPALLSQGASAVEPMGAVVLFHNHCEKHPVGKELASTALSGDKEGIVVLFVGLGV